jgi:hypothetical protein
MTEGKHAISVWFFIGVLLTIYGALIMGAGLYDLLAGVRRETVLAGSHPGVWWGALLLVLGVIYLYFFSPGRRKR